MLKKITFVLAITFCFLNTQCEEDDIVNDTCGNITIVDASLFDTANSEGLSIINAAIEDDCLNLDVGAGGCDGSTWEFYLIDSEVVTKSIPPQRVLKIDFKDLEDCEAYIRTSISFDLRPLRIGDSGDVVLRLVDSNQELKYSY